MEGTKMLPSNRYDQEMKRNPYDRLAGIYDPLSRVLGRTYLNSKSLFLEEIKAGDKILYLGGGTGANLPTIVERIGDNGKVVYVELSGEMIKKAKSRISVSALDRVDFLQQGDFSKIPNEKYNKILTQYFLDILSDEEIQRLFYHINLRVDEKTQWIFLDFFNIKGKRVWLSIMIGFFRLFARNPRKDLPEYFDYFESYGWKIRKIKSIKNGFIRSWLLHKTEA